MFVLPQFGSVLHDFGAKIDPIARAFLSLSEFMNTQKELIGAAAIILFHRHCCWRVMKISRSYDYPGGSLAGHPYCSDLAPDRNILP